MSVIRVSHQKNYVVILNDTVLTDPNLSFKAKGLWAYCMSKPDDWIFNVGHLMTVSKEKRDSVYSAINELVDAGYIKKIQRKEKGKFINYDYEVYEIKIILPLPGFPDTDKPDTENPPLLSIEVNQVLKKNLTSSKEESSQVLQKDREKLLKIPLRKIDIHSGAQSIEYFSEENYVHVLN
jgi:hypothetical protein